MNMSPAGTEPDRDQSTHKNFTLRVSGELACFSDPAFSERISYPIPTPCGIEGTLKSVHWRRGIRYCIDEMMVLAPIRYLNFRRNEIDHVPRMTSNGFDGADYPIQRMTTCLKDVDYHVRCHLDLDDGYQDRREVRKSEDILARYLDKGRSFRQPYLGMEEFGCEVRWADEADPKPISESRPLGRMVYGYVWDNVANKRKVILTYEPVLVRGVIRVPSRAEVLRQNGVTA